MIIDMLEIERDLIGKGYKYIAGVDEVGRGPLCGSVVSAAVILPENFYNPNINDSKKLSEKKREFLYDVITQHAIAIGIGVVDAQTIDKINIKQATKLAMKTAINNLNVKPDYVLVDAEVLELEVPSKGIVKGDSLSQTIAAASIVAKVIRDRMCIEWHQQFPDYNIIKHKGYGTKEHREILKLIGPSPIHRMSFLKNILG